MRVGARGMTFDVTAGGPYGEAGGGSYGEAGGDAGPDEAPVLLLHGFPQHVGMWGAVSARLHAAGLRTFAPNQRGYSPGARPVGAEHYSTGDLVADVVALLDALDLRRVHLVGHDWGALVGWQVAGRHADRVATLTAVSVPHPAAFGAALRTDPDQQARSAYLELFRQEGKAEEVLLADGARALRAIFGGSGLDEAGVAAYVAPMLEPGALTGALSWYRGMTVRQGAGVGAVRVPTTFVWGDQDVAVGRVAAEGCADLVEGPFTYVELAGVSHWVPDQVPDALADAVLARIRD